jgi:hypothetical protein
MHEGKYAPGGLCNPNNTKPKYAPRFEGLFKGVEFSKFQHLLKLNLGHDGGEDI